MIRYRNLSRSLFLLFTLGMIASCKNKASESGATQSYQNNDPNISEMIKTDFC